jgi:DNA-binding SARP family transcriptional activator
MSMLTRTSPRNPRHDTPTEELATQPIRANLLGDAYFETHSGIRMGHRTAVLGFSLLLRLVLARGRAVSRSELAELLWGSDDRRTRARLRVLLARLREYLIPIIASGSTLRLTTSDVDWTAEFPDPPLRDFVAPSDRYERWLDAQRPSLVERFVEPYREELADAQRRGEWRRLEYLARDVIEISPLDEAGNLALVEALSRTSGVASSRAQLQSYQAALEGDDRPPRSSIADPGRNLDRRVTSVLAARVPVESA